MAINTFAAEIPAVQSHQHIYRKVAWRLVPFLCLCYLAAYLDRVNVGFAKLQMLNDLSFSNTIYGIGAGIFFFGYVLFEVPSNIVMHKVGAKLWIARIMISWGIIAAAMVFVKTPTQFYVLRFLLGVAEAGFIPGVLLYLTYWFPAAWRGKIVAIFLAAIPMSNIIGGPLSGWILASFSDAGGLRGWQWLFLIETIPSILLGIVTLFYLDNSVLAASWLNDEEKRLIAADIAAEGAQNSGHSSVASAFKSGKVWLLGLAYFCIASAIYVISFWLPTLIKQRGVSDPLQIGWLTAIPYTVAIFTMVYCNISADRTRERRWHTAIPCFLTGLGLICSALPFDSLILAMLALTVAAAGASTTQAAFWSLPSSFLTGAAAAAGIALVNSLGNIAGMVSTSLVGWLTDLTGGTQSSLYIFGVLTAMGGVLVLRLPAAIVNK
ncbi:MAG: MFS transporter [Burkholderiaceae bacterium]|jgi:MFS family permease